jgi:hypothetical protein
LLLDRGLIELKDMPVSYRPGYTPPARTTVLEQMQEATTRRKPHLHHNKKEPNPAPPAPDKSLVISPEMVVDAIIELRVKAARADALEVELERLRSIEDEVERLRKVEAEQAAKIRQLQEQHKRWKGGILGLPTGQ